MTKDVFKRLYKYLKKGYVKLVIIVFICIIVSSVAAILSSTFIKTLIDNYITPLLLEENPVYTGLLKMLFIMGSIYAIGLITSYLYNRIMAIVAQGILRDIRNDLFDKMEDLPISYFDNNKYGDIMSRFTNDTDALEGMISQGIPTMISCVTTVLGIYIAMLLLSIPLALFIILFTFFLLFVIKNFTKSSGKYFMQRQEILGKENAYIEEMINGSKVIKVFTHENVVKKDFDKVNSDLCEANYKANAYANTVFPLIGSLGNIEYVLVAIIGGLFAIKFNASITVGTIASFLSLTRSFNRPIGQLSSQVNQIIMSIAGAKRIFAMMDEAKEIDKGKVTLVNYKVKNGIIYETKERTESWAWKIPNGESFDYVELKGKVELNNVTFAYDGNEVLHDISLYAKPGQKIAFVGSTGAGKTTITNLINRFYEIKSGEILYDGIDIKDIKKSSLRKSLGMVLQDTSLFTGTIMENIKYGRLDATDEEVIEACKIANADTFIRMLPEGYDTLLESNGSNLSQGQRQLLSIARCNLADPPVMILDEATSSIDTRTEKIIQDGMDKLMEGRTVFVIAHRLSTIKNSKAIMVLSHGNIIERGEHEDLLKQKGEYYELYTGKVELD